MMEWIQQHEKLLNSPFYLFLRHGERFPIEPGDLGDKALLTPNGEQQALKLGQLLKGFTPFQVFTSTVQRCFDTGSHLMKGAGLEGAPLKSELLASGYIKDFKQLMSSQKEIKFEKVLKTFMKEGSYTGFYSKEEGSKRIMDFMAESTGQQSAVFISHDALIMPFLNHLLNVDFSDSWLNYLSGALIPKRRPEEMVWIQAGTPSSLPA